ncbi:hypothetical protein BUE76_05575 [Cnuella takakiae]|nr:hypothetical protein BUE76_05575 [Cnuella takakiae]
MLATIGMQAFCFSALHHPVTYRRPIRSEAYRLVRLHSEKGKCKFKTKQPADLGYRCRLFCLNLLCCFL